MKSFLSIVFPILILIAEQAIGFQVSRIDDNQPINDTLKIAREMFSKGVALDDAGKTEESTAAIHEALRLASTIRDYPLMARSLNFLAINLSAMGRRDEGIEMSFKAYENFLLAGDSVRAANVKINIGMDYTNNGNFEEALKIELEALDLRLQCGDSTNIAAYYQRLGEVYKQLGIRDKWKSSLETANRLSDHPKYASFKTKIGIMNDYGGIYEAERQYNEAIKVYLKMYELSKKEDYLNGIATALTNMSPVYRNMGQNEKALKCAREALQIQLKRENGYGQLTAYNQLGEVYLVMGSLNQAQENFQKGLKLSLNMNYINEQIESLNGLYRVARKKGNLKDALLYHEKWSQLEDSLQNTDLQKKLTEIETRYQTGKKEQQIKLLNSENKLKSSRIELQKLTIGGGSLFFLILLVFAFFIFNQKRKQQITRQNELEQKLLRSQMNPHFIFNSLGAIQQFMMKNDGRKAAFYLSSFSSLMRSILKNSREELITLQEEKQTLENYLHLHQLRLGNRLSFVVNVAEELEMEDTILPPMLIQPFVENAIIHGIEKMEGNGEIVVLFSIENNFLKIIVKDNGKGIDQNRAGKRENHVSYALQIFEERIANLKKSSGMDISYKIGNKGVTEDQNRGTVVTVLLPLKIR